MKTTEVIEKIPNARGSRFKKRNGVAGFSLVEVTLAIGIISFAMVPIFGLLPVGLRSVKNANEQAGAANVLGAITESLRTASSTNNIDFSGTFAGKPIVYTVGQAGPVTVAWTNLTLEGVTNSMNSRLSAVLTIYPSTNQSTPGRAVISVAWPASSDNNWNANSRSWAKAEGSITSGIQFLPGQ